MIEWYKLSSALANPSHVIVSVCSVVCRGVELFRKFGVAFEAGDCTMVY